MKKLKTLIFALLIFFASSCEENESIDKELVIQLSKSWTHSFEENEINLVQIYRPNNYKEFPAARFRQKFILNTDFTCEYLALSPTDAHYMTEKKWTLEDSELITIKDSDNSTVSKIRIIELTNDMLKVEIIN